MSFEFIFQVRDNPVGPKGIRQDTIKGEDK